jgi:hypothetical protein
MQGMACKLADIQRQEKIEEGEKMQADRSSKQGGRHMDRGSLAEEDMQRQAGRGSGR